MDHRLRTVADCISSQTHADIGSDHGLLLAWLLRSGRIARGIAIENKRQPFENSRRAMRGLPAEVRFADGLEGLRAGEADSLSICGIGGTSMATILGRRPERLPHRLVLQPNRREDLVRQWALVNGFHLVDERISVGHWRYQIMVMENRGGVPDPAYARLDRDAALLFGPLLLSRGDEDLFAQLHEECNYLSEFRRLGSAGHRRLDAIRRVL